MAFRDGHRDVLIFIFILDSVFVLFCSVFLSYPCCLVLSSYSQL